MSVTKAFSEICRRICEGQGWDLLPSGVQITWKDGRHQLVCLEVFEHEGEQRLRLFTTIGATGNLTPVRLNIALRINYELVHGAFAIRDEDLIMVDTLRLESMDEREIAAAIHFLAETADYYEKAIYETDDY